MDGVLVDFKKGYYHLTGVDLKGLYVSTDEFWDPINNAGYNFWVNLEWTKDGKPLWDYIKQYNPTILTAPSKLDCSIHGKTDWINREIKTSNVVFKYRKNKKELASPNSILIDDMEENILDWVSSGGIGILHKNTKKTIKELKKLGL